MAIPLSSYQTIQPRGANFKAILHPNMTHSWPSGPFTFGQAVYPWAYPYLLLVHAYFKPC